MRFSDMVDINELREMCESFTALTGAATAIIDDEGAYLVAAGWQPLCVQFHRENPITVEYCRESKTALFRRLGETDVFQSYKCKNGLIDVAIPIRIGGKHIATLFTGQFFFAPPDENYFISQAEACGFDKTAYLDAVRKVPVIPEARAEIIMRYLSRLARIIGEMGMTRKNLEQINTELSRHKEHLKEMVADRTAELNSAKNQAEAANRAKSVFLAKMSHEFRTPLNSVLGYARLMKNDDDLPPQHSGSLDSIIRGGEHLQYLINDVLEMSKIEAGSAELDEADFDLHECIDELQTMMSIRASEKGLDFLVERSPELPSRIRTDPGKLRQVLINLVGNAVKYTNEGEISLYAGIVARKSDGSVRLRFEVKDTGPGIRAEDTARIFAAFVQLKEQPDADPGTGLGLSISKQFVELMGGEIGVESEPGKGSMFYFEIPAIELPHEPVIGKPAKGRVIGLAEGQPRYRLLVAEDNPANRMLLHEILKPFEFDIFEAANGQEAIEYFERHRPELIFMDISMPVLNGLHASRRIKSTEAGARTKIIALTAHAFEEEKQEILSAGCDDFIRKPYKETDIFDSLAKHLNVRFRYSEPKPSSSPRVEKNIELEPVMLKKLSRDVIEDLRMAAELLDERHCYEIIRRIGDFDAIVGNCLAGMIAHFQYKELLGILDDYFANKQ